MQAWEEAQGREKEQGRSEGQPGVDISLATIRNMLENLNNAVNIDCGKNILWLKGFDVLSFFTSIHIEEFHKKQQWIHFSCIYIS